MRLFHTGTASITFEESEVLRQFMLLEWFHIRPWEYNDDHEVYREDLANLLNIKRLQLEAEAESMKKAQWRGDVQGRLSKK